MCLWRCLRMRLTFKWEDLVKHCKHVLPSVLGPHPLYWLRKRWDKIELFLSAWLSESTFWSSLDSQMRLWLRLELYHWFSTWPTAYLGLLSLHNCMSQFLIINLFIYTYIGVSLKHRFGRYLEIKTIPGKNEGVLNYNKQANKKAWLKQKIQFGLNYTNCRKKLLGPEIEILVW